MNPNKKQTWDLVDAKLATKYNPNGRARKIKSILLRKLKKAANRKEMRIAMIDLNA